ncbi:hypothetical protein ABFS83_11G010500 [Erythranthe nasuta]
MSSAITQLSCFSSIVTNRRLNLQSGSYRLPTRFRPGKVLNVTNSYEHRTTVSSSEKKTTPSYTKDASHNQHIEEQVVSQSKTAAKIHDFCLGIPFGGLILGGGLVGFIFSRSAVTLSTGVLFGSAILALSIFSMKVWREGESSFPFILGQAVLSVAFLWKNFQAYFQTKKLFPTGFNVVISAAMLCFYYYVVISGGNPPPKKLKPETAAESS